jgi:hypothetical protein
MRIPAAVLCGWILLASCRGGAPPAASRPPEDGHLAAAVAGLDGAALKDRLREIAAADASSPALRGFAHLRLARLAIADPPETARAEALRRFDAAESAFREAVRIQGSLRTELRDALAKSLLAQAKYGSLFEAHRADATAALDRAAAAEPSADLRLRVEMARLSLLPPGDAEAIDGWRERVETILAGAPKTELWHVAHYAIIRSVYRRFESDPKQPNQPSETDVQLVVETFRRLEASTTPEGRPWIDAARQLIEAKKERHAEHRGIRYVSPAAAAVEFPAELRDYPEVAVFRTKPEEGEGEDEDADVERPDLPRSPPIARYRLGPERAPWMMPNPGPGTYEVVFSRLAEAVAIDLHVTDLMGLALTDGRQLVVQTFHRWNGSAMADARVSLRHEYEGEKKKEDGETQRVVWRVERTTDANGQLAIDLPRASEWASSQMILSRGAERVKFEVRHDARRAAPDFQVFAHADRPVYRPGETVSWRAIIRQIGLEAPVVPAEESFQATLIGGHESGTLHTGVYRADAFGVIHGSVELPARVPHGAYRIVIQPDRRPLPEELSHAGLPLFVVESYRLPEFGIEVRLPDRPLRPGDAAEIEIDVRYFFGPPVAGAEGMLAVTCREEDDPDPWAWMEERETEWDVRHTAWGADPPRRPRGPECFSLHDQDEPLSVAAIPFRTDDAGRARVPFRFPPARRKDRTYLFRADVRDATGETVKGEASRRVDARSVRLTIIRSGYWIGAGAPVAFGVLAEGPGGKPVAATVRVALGPGGRLADPIREDDAAEGMTRAADGRIDFALRAKGSGGYAIVARAVPPGEPEIVARGWVWVSGPTAGEAEGAASRPLTVIVAAPRVAAGGTIKGELVLPPGSQGAFVALAWDRVHRWTYLRGAGVIPFELEAPAAAAPRVALLAAAVAQDRIHQEHRVIEVDDPADLLEVRARTDRETYEPGGRVRVEFEAVDGRGRPVEAEIGLSVADEKVFAVRSDETPPIRSAIRRPAPLFSIGHGETHFEGRGVFFTLEEEKGVTGATFVVAESLETSIPDGVAIRRDFSTTACWLPALRTDASGRAAAEFRLPDSLTAWRFTARAVGREFESGETRRQAVARKELMVRLALPRVLRERDRSVLRATIHNETDGELEVAAAFESEGLRLDEAPGPKRARVPPRGTAGLDWPVVAASEGRARIRVAARAAAAGGDGPVVSDAIEVFVPVLPHAIEEVASRLVPLKAGRTRIEFPIADGQTPSEAKVVLSLSRLHALREVLPGLAGYPYG